MYLLVKNLTNVFETAVSKAQMFSLRQKIKRNGLGEKAILGEKRILAWKRETLSREFHFFLVLFVCFPWAGLIELANFGRVGSTWKNLRLYLRLAKKWWWYRGVLYDVNGVENPQLSRTEYKRVGRYLLETPQLVPTEVFVKEIKQTLLKSKPHPRHKNAILAEHLVKSEFSISKTSEFAVVVQYMKAANDKMASVERTM